MAFAVFAGLTMRTAVEMTGVVTTVRIHPESPNCADIFGPDYDFPIASNFTRYVYNCDVDGSTGMIPATINTIGATACACPAGQGVDRSGYSGDVCVAPSAASCGRLSPKQVYVYDSGAGACFAPSAEVCRGLTPPQFYSETLSALGCATYALCVAAEDCELSEDACREGFSPRRYYDSDAEACVAPSAESCGELRPVMGYDSDAVACVAPSAESCGELRPVMGYDSDAEACVAPSADSCGGLIPAQGYDSGAGACEVCSSGEGVLADGTCGACPAEQVVYGGVCAACGSGQFALNGVCAAASAESCRGLSPAEVYDSGADACVAASKEVCEGLTPEEFYDATARECVAIATCASPAVRNAETNQCYCPSGYSGDGGVCNADVTVSFSPPVNGTLSAASGGDSIQNGGTVVYGATITFTAAPVIGYEVSIWTGGCAGAVGISCEVVATADVSVGVEFDEDRAEICASMTPAQFYDATTEECVAAAVCASPAVRNTETNQCECPSGYSGDGVVCNADVTVSFSSPVNGTLSAASGGDSIQNGGTVIHGATVTFTAEPASGYAVSIWTGVCAGAVGVSCEAVATANVSVGVEFFEEASAESCRRLSPAQGYDSAAGACEVCSSGEGVLADGTCGVCPSGQGVLADKTCGVCPSGQFILGGACTAPSAESCRRLSPAQGYDDSGAGACEVCSSGRGNPCRWNLRLLSLRTSRC